MTVELALLDAQTLKDKRRVVLSLKQKLMNRFNVSVAEVAYPNAAKRCRLGIAVVAGDSRSAHSQLDQLVDVIRRSLGVTLVDYERRLC